MGPPWSKSAQIAFICKKVECHRILRLSMLLLHMTSQLKGVQHGDAAAVAHGVARLLNNSEHSPGRTLPPTAPSWVLYGS